MKGMYIAALAVVLCCHVLLVQSSESQRRPQHGNNKGKNSAKKNKPSAKMDVAGDSVAASPDVPTHATDNTDVNPFVMSGLFEDQGSVGDPSAVMQSPLLKSGKGKGSKTKGGKNKGGNLKPMKANEKGGANSKNKGQKGARKPNKTGKGKSN